MGAQRVSSIIRELELLPKSIEKVIQKHDKEVKKVAKEYAHYEHALYIGRDTLYPAALEGALKLKEVSYVHADG